MKHLKLFDGFLNEKKFSSAEREKLADKGFALPDGSYPIADVEDLKNAVSAFGRSNPEKRKAVAQHIAKRAKALGKEDLIPQTEIFQKALQESINEEIDIHDRLADLMNKLQVQISNLQQEAKGDKDWSKALSGIKSSFDQLEDKISISAKKLGVINEGVVSIKGGRILAHKVLNKLVDMEVIPVKKKTEDLVEAIASLLASASLNEASYEEINEAALNRNQMMDWIKKSMKFVRTTEDFDGSKGGIWLSAENGDTFKGKPIYNYYAESPAYDLGVLAAWEKELNSRGWYSEWNDAGTVMVWPD